MGICKGPNARKEEVKILGSSIHQIDPFLYQVCPSICKIIFSNKVGRGFFIKLYKSNKLIFLLMTNEHIIKKEMIDNKEEIEVYYNNQISRIKITLNKEERFIQSFKEKEELKIDCTIVEILKKDKVDERYFLLPNIDYNSNNYNELINKIVYVVQFPGGKNLSYSKGELINIDKYDFTHKAGTKSGSSGSPIFLANTTNVIGIHKSGNEYKKENYGDFIFPIINLLKKKIDINSISKNYINANNRIIRQNKQNEVKMVIKRKWGDFFMFNHEFVENNKDKCEIIINGKKGFNLDLNGKNEKNYLNEKIKKNNGIFEIIIKETKTIRNMDYMLDVSENSEFISIDFEKWDITNVTSMKYMFMHPYSFCFNNIKGISNWNTSNVTNMSNMFFRCTTIPNISNWNTSKVLDMSYMFYGCNNIPDISNWNTSKVLDMSYMFGECNNIPDISNWDTSNVKNMKGIFYHSINLCILPDISKWNMNNVECMAQMFEGCKSLKSLPNISKWETFCAKDMSYMFHNCWALTSFPNISDWKIYNVNNMSHMFHNCWSLTSFPLLKWDISNVKDMSFMFHNFPLSLIAFHWDISENQNTFHMFTNFDNYHNPLLGNDIIDLRIRLESKSICYIVHAYLDMLVGDAIDLFYKNHTNLDNPFKIKFIFGTKSINKLLTVYESGISNGHSIYGYIPGGG